MQLEIFNQFDVPINMERVLHRDQKLVFHRPILAGDKLYFDSYLDSVTESHGAVVTEIRGEVTDADGKPVITSIVTVMGEAASDSEADEVSAQIAAARDAAIAKMIAGQSSRKGEQRPVGDNRFSRRTCCGGSPTTGTASAGWSRGPGRSART